MKLWSWMTCVHAGIEVRSGCAKLGDTTIASVIDKNRALLKLVALPRDAELEVDAVETLDKVVFELNVSHGAVFTP